MARYLLHLAAQDDESLVTQMQLHKLLYYAQGWSLACMGRPLFRGTIQAWRHGPVVKELYPVFADHRNDPIPPREARPAEELSSEDRAIVASVWMEYGRFSAAFLRRMTHEESPWAKARIGLPEDAPSDREITHSDLREHFMSKRADRCQLAGFSAEQIDLSLEQFAANQIVDFPPSGRPEPSIRR